MKIAHLDTEISWRGGEQQILYLAEALREAGDENLIIARSGSALESKAQQAGFSCFPVSPKMEWDFFEALLIRRRLRGANFDILHAHTAHAAALGALASLRGDIPLIVSRRVDFHLSKNPFSRWKYLRAAKILAVSSAIKQILIQDGISPERIEVLYSGVNLKRFEGDKKSRQDLRLPDSKILIGQIAALSDQKDPLNFVQAMAVLAQKGVDFRVLMAGDGPLKIKVEEEIKRLNLKDIVFVLGFREDALEILRHLDVFVLSSRWEGLGTSILDALAAGVPVVASRTGGIPEMIEEGVSGLLVAPGDPASLARAIERILLDAALRERLIAGGREKVQFFSAQKMAQSTRAVYQRILAKA
jgi:glycosyltransferase involved in cell wall biosynthesis